MHSKDKKAEFLYYRSQNWSLIRISEQIRVCRNTLIQWNREYTQTLRVLRSIETDHLHEKILLARQQDLTRLVERQTAIEKELAARALDDLPTEKLFRLASLIREEVNQARLDTKQLVGAEPYISDGVPFWRRMQRSQTADDAPTPAPNPPEPAPDGPAPAAEKGPAEPI